MGEMRNSVFEEMPTDFFFFFLRPHLRYMEVPRLEVELELQLGSQRHL